MRWIWPILVAISISSHRFCVKYITWSYLFSSTPVWEYRVGYTESYMTVFMVDGHRDHPDDDGKFQSEHRRDLSWRKWCPVRDWNTIISRLMEGLLACSTRGELSVSSFAVLPFEFRSAELAGSIKCLLGRWWKWCLWGIFQGYISLAWLLVIVESVVCPAYKFRSCMQMKPWAWILN